MKNTIFVLVVLLPVLTCQARIITVDDDLPADFNNIQAAIDDANDGDTVEVQTGTYTGPGNRDIDFLGKAITVRSTDPNDPDIVAATVIDCNGTESDPHRGFYFHNDEDANSILNGFTIKKGCAPIEKCSMFEDCSRGGGIYCSASSPRIENCVVMNCTAWLDTWFQLGISEGGGIYCADSHALIKGCVVRDNGNFPALYELMEPNPLVGGGIAMTNSQITMEDCMVFGNAAGWGGGIGCDGGQLRLFNCTIVGNVAMRAAGLLSGRSDCLISGCTISNNKAMMSGGGIESFEGSMTLENSLICGNVTVGYEDKPPKGGAMSCNQSSPEIKNCTIHGNGIREDGVAGGMWFDEWSNPRFLNCVVWGNEDAQIAGGHCVVMYSNIQGGWPEGEGNIDADPCFADPGHLEDPCNTPDNWRDDVWVDGDYHLKSQAGRRNLNTNTWVVDSNTSPCIDRGDPMSPIGHEPFPNGGIINMGAYGGTREASKSYFGKPPCEIIVAGDINGDCIVNFLDFRLMALHWLENYNP